MKHINNMEVNKVFFDDDLEKSVLSALTKSEVLARQHVPQLSEGHFENPDCLKYYGAMVKLINENQKVGRVSLLAALKPHGMERPQVYMIADKVTSSKHVKTHIEQLTELKVKRDLSEMLREVSMALIDPDKDNASILSLVSSKV